MSKTITIQIEPRKPLQPFARELLRNLNDVVRKARQQMGVCACADCSDSSVTAALTGYATLFTAVSLMDKDVATEVIQEGIRELVSEIPHRCLDKARRHRCAQNGNPA